MLILVRRFQERVAEKQNETSELGKSFCGLAVRGKGVKEKRERVVPGDWKMNLIKIREVIHHNVVRVIRHWWMVSKPFISQTWNLFFKI